MEGYRGNPDWAGIADALSVPIQLWGPILTAEREAREAAQPEVEVQA